MNFKKVLSLIIVIIFCVTILSGCGEENKNITSTTMENSISKPQKSIVLFGGNEAEGYWKNIKKGGEEAAKKYGFTFRYLGVEEGTNNIVTTHISNIGKVVDEGVSGVVIAPEGEGYSEIYGRLFEEKIPVVQINDLTEEDFERIESNKKNPIVSIVSTDNKQAGTLCAEKVFEKIKGDIEKSEGTYIVGVVGRADNIADEEKINGFIEKFSELADVDSKTKDKYKIETENETDYQESFDDLIRDKAKAVFITHPDVSDEISDIVSAETEKYKNMIFCGFDSGAKQLKWLTVEKGGRFIGGIAQDAYNIGFNAVEQCAFAVEGKDIKEKIEIEGKWYDKQNVDKLKQDKLVFEK